MGRFAHLLGAALAWCLTQTAFSKPLAIERNLTIEGSEKTLSLEEAMSRLTKAGINLGYQSFIIFYPATGQGLTWRNLMQGADPARRHTLGLAPGRRFN